MAWIAGAFVVASALLILWLLPAQRFLEQYRRALVTPGSDTPRTRSEVHLPNGRVGVDTYEFPQNQAETTLIMVPGLHPAGIEDPRFISFAGCIARSGFRVVAIDIPKFRQFQITPDTVDLIENVIRTISDSSESRSKNLGVLGISYGAGPVFVAASRDSVREKVNFLVSIGGYYSLAHAIEFSLTGRHLQDPPREAHPWGRMIFAYQHLEDLPLGSDRAILKESLHLRLTLKDREAQTKEESLSPEGKAFLEQLLGTLSPETLDSFHKILQKHIAVANSLSPETVIADLPPKVRIYLVHGAGDNSVPFEETQELAKAMRNAGIESVRSHITDVLTHVDTIRSREVMDSLRLLWWTRWLLSEASQTSQW